MATYYSDTEASAPLRTVFKRIVQEGTDSFEPSPSEYSVRYAGYVASTISQRYTFGVALAGADRGERVKLWVDNKLVIDQWTSLDLQAPSGTLAIDQVSSVC